MVIYPTANYFICSNLWLVGAFSFVEVANDLLLVGNNLPDEQLQQLVDKTMLWTDRDGDGEINFEEFSHVVGNNLGKMISFDNV